MPHIKGQSGIEWFYDLEGEGEALIFLHGWGVDRRIWRQQSKFFSQKYKVLAIDLPGHGQSGWLKISFTEMAKDLAGVLKDLGLSDISFVGSSVGGMLGLKVYSLAPQIFKRLVLVGSMPKFARSDDYPCGLDVAKIRKLNGQLEFAYPSIVNIFFRSLFTQEERESRRFKWLQKFRQTDEVPMKQALSEYLDILEHQDVRSILKDVKVPMQFINGTGDEICNQQTISFLRQAKPESRFDDFEKCGHFPFLSKPHEFNNVLSEFLDQTK